MEKLQYKLDGLCCANCAAKIELQIGALDGIETSQVDFIHKTLTVQTSLSEDVLQTQAKQIIESIDNNINLVSANKKSKEHQEEHDTEEFSWVQMIVSAILFITAILLGNVFHYALAAEICYGLSAAVAGYHVFISGIKGLFKLKMNENTLMAIAIIAAFAIGEYLEAAMVAILFNIGEMLEDYAVEKSRKSIEHLADIRPDTARKLVGEEETILPAEKMNIGELIRVHPYERIPLDGIIDSGSSLLDSSALTGESLPIEASEGTEVLSGMMNGEGMLTVKITNDFSHSAASRILDMVESASARKGSAEKLITRFAAVYTPIVIGLAVLLMSLPPLLGLGAFQVWLYRALIFLVASCPCALVISVPLGFYAGIGAESKTGVLVKGGKYMEALSKTSAVVFDKTGTLTNGNLSVTKIVSLGKLSEKQLLQISASAEQFSSHPAAKAVLEQAEKDGCELLTAENVNESAGHGVSAKVNGKQILCGRNKLLEAHSISLQNIPPASIYIAIDDTIEGYIELSDTLKPDTVKAIEALKANHINRVVMLTGDHEKAAKAIAEQCGITEYHAELLPEDKVALMEQIRKESGTTLFVGDGINDAPVLAASDCGVAMGLGTDAAIEASDVVLTVDKPSKLADAIWLSRKAMNVIRANIVFALLIKAIVLVLAALGFAPMWLAVFADVGVSMIAVMNSTRILYFKKK